MRNLLFIVSFIFSLAALANVQDAFNQGMNTALAHQQNGYAVEQNFNPKQIYDSYTDNPTQSKYYTGATQTVPSQMNQDAIAAMTQSPTGNTLLNSMKNRPQYEISATDRDVQHDPLLENEANTIVSNTPGTPHDYQQSQDFAKGISALSSAHDAAASFDGTVIFKGHAQQCRDEAGDFSNCCNPSGWGQDLNLAHCSQEEQTLGKNRQNGVTIYVGDYCAHHLSWPLDAVCVEHKQTYCTFESKLARIIQEQGRQKQLKISFGSAESPNCQGLTPEQLQRIDMEQINFSEFYDDVNQKTKSPDVAHVQDTINQHIQQYQATGQAHG